MVLMPESGRSSPVWPVAFVVVPHGDSSPYPSREELVLSAEEQHVHDDERRSESQERDEHADPNRPPNPNSETVQRQHPGGNPGDPGAAAAPSQAEDEHGSTNAERARKRRGGTLEDGSELPG